MLTFTLTEAEAQIILDALVQQPYIVVAPVVAKVQQQAAEQMQPIPTSSGSPCGHSTPPKA